MKLLIITQRVDSTDTILGYFLQYIEAFAEHFEKVYVICLEKGEYDLPDNVKVMSLGKEEGVSTITYFIRFYKHVIPLLFGKKSVNRIFVHMNEIYVLLLAPLLPLRKLQGIQLDWWKCHGHISYKAKIGRFFVDRVVTCSQSAYPVKTKKKHVFGQGVDTTLFVPGKIREVGNIIAVGRMSQVKHYEDLIKAVAHVNAKKVRVCAHIIGCVETDEKNKYFNMLRDTVHALRLEKSVLFEPAVKNIEIVPLYQRADMLVNTSDTDSMDKVVIEAMACGVIPISSNLAYEPILASYKLFVQKRDIEGLARVIESVLDMKEDEKDQLRKAMRDIAVEEHDTKNLIKKIVNT